MKNINRDKAIYVMLAIAAVTAIATYWITAPSPLDFKSGFSIFGTAVTVDTLFAAAFTKWFWKWPCFRYLNWLVIIPNLNGTWRGEIRSTWQDPLTDKRLTPIPAVLTIRQTLFSISCVVRTEEMTSRSFSAAFVISDEEQREDLTYSYNSVPNQTVIERSRQHTGSSLLEIDGSSDPTTLCGHYWSDRKTTGEIEFSFVDRNETKCFPDDMKKQHPASAARNYEG